jgi:signal peptidase I
MDMRRIRTELTEWARVVGGAFLAYLAFTTVAFAQYAIPSESMVPHIEVGDRVTVSKFAYGYSRRSLPFNAGLLLPASTHRFAEQMPQRGDVAVFVHPMSGETMIKRVIGLPGDTIAIRDRTLWINGVAVETSAPELVMRRVHPRGRELAERQEETLPGGLRHAIHNLTDGGQFDEFAAYTIPPGHLFMMGDNRDNSLDSRWSGMGAVPMENLIGRAEFIYYVQPGCWRDPTVACPMPRWMRPLHN